jgi:hypothetical protein
VITQSFRRLKRGRRLVPSLLILAAALAMSGASASPRAQAALMAAFSTSGATSSLRLHASRVSAASCSGSSCTGQDPYATRCNIRDSVAGSAAILDRAGRPIGQIRLYWSSACQANWGQAYFNDGNPASTPPVDIKVVGSSSSAAYDTGLVDFTYTSSGSPVWGDMVYSPGCAYATVARGDATGQAIQARCPRGLGAAPANWCTNPAVRSSRVPCGDMSLWSFCISHNDTLTDILKCAAENYYASYFQAFVKLQAYHKNNPNSNPPWAGSNVLQQVSGLWGDIYTDNLKQTLLHNGELPCDEGPNSHITDIPIIGPIRGWLPGAVPDGHGGCNVYIENLQGLQFWRLWAFHYTTQ